MKTNLKKLYTLNYILIALCVAGTAILLVFTPDTIPAHYNFAGEIDRFGSKYENLIFPALALLMGSFFLIYARKQGKKQGVSNEKVILWGSAAALFFLDATGFYYMIKAIRYEAVAGSVIQADSTKFGSIAIGIMLILLGNIMPKVRRNPVFGLRTKWSMADDSVWQKSQRFGGISSVLCGFLMLISAIFASGIWNAVFLVLLLAVWVIASVIASYRYYKTDSAAQK